MNKNLIEIKKKDIKNVLFLGYVAFLYLEAFL